MRSQAAWENVDPCKQAVSANLSLLFLERASRTGNKLNLLSNSTTVKRAKRPLKIDKTKIFMANGSLLKVESIADGEFVNIFDLHLAIIGLENHFCLFESVRYTQVLL